MYQVGVNAELCDFIDAMALDKEFEGQLVSETKVRNVAVDLKIQQGTTNCI